MSEIKEFKTESKRLLDLMINSIYTNKEIFLRELISNASDAIDKYHYLSLTDNRLEKGKDYQIEVIRDEEKRILKISDNGIGMTYDEINANLGTIAKSGSLEFMKNLNQDTSKDEIDIIGQFGVGFYSAFMVADQIEVETKSPFSDKAYRFTSDASTYQIDEIEDRPVGTTIILHLRKEEEENYDLFLEEYTIKDLVKKYSDYIRYPIKMKVIEKEYDDEGKVLTENKELKTLNSMIPIWKKRKNEVSENELKDFYKNKYNDHLDPLTSIFINVEGNINYNALVYIPKKPPYNLYSEKFEKGLQLYTKGVFIMDKCKDLVPDYLRFIKGLVDSSDLSLNISREILQQNRQLIKIAQNVEKKVLSELEKMMNQDFDKYLEFFDHYGINLKYGIYDQFGEKKDLLKDLLIYQSINESKKVSLKYYVEHMGENQKEIYYASGKTKESVLAMPQMDLIKNQGFDVLILSDDIDEFVISILENYMDKKFKSINQGDLDLLSKEDKEKIEEKETTSKSLLENLKELLKNEVSDVVLSKRLTDSPVCLVSGEGISFEMEKVISAIPNANETKAKRILEINPNHDLFQAIEKMYEDHDEDLQDYATLLYNQAQLMEGFAIDNPAEFSKKLCKLMIKSTK